MPTLREEMRALDTRNFSWYNNLGEEDKKSLNMWVLMRYASAIDSRVDEITEHYLVFINEFVNVHFNAIRKHPDMQWRLMQVCAVGSPQMHAWIKPGKRKGKINGNKKMAEFYLSLHPHLNDNEVEWVLGNMSRDEKTCLLEDAGIDKKEIKNYLK